MDLEVLLWSLTGIGLTSLACQWIAWRIRLPAILFLLLSGILAGPVSGWLNPDLLFGHLLAPMVSLAVAVILFEGSLTLRWEEIRGLERVIRNLVTFGALVEWGITALATHLIVGFDWALSVLFGALMVVTGPTVIVPLLRSVRPHRHVANILRWEGILIDPLGALLAVLVFEFLLAGHETALSHTSLTFVKIVLSGLVLGALGGYGFGLALRNFWLPEYLDNFAALTLVFGIYTLAETLEKESGLLAVTVMGIWLTNMRGVSVAEILNFKESLSLLLISGLFIILAARLDLSQFQLLGPAALLGTFLAVQLLSRPVKVLLSTLASDLSFRERLLLAFIGPRGIVAAAVTAIFAMRLEQHGEREAALLVPLAFTVIMGTVIFQSLLARPLAKWLGLVEPPGSGFLILGANRVARTLARALQEAGVEVLLADTSWDQVREARMEGLPTYYGNLVSEQADRDLDLVGLGALLALSPNAELNALACLKYRAEFGSDQVYGVKTEGQEVALDRAKPVGRILFGEEVTFQRLASWLEQGATVRRTKLSKSFDWEAYRVHHGARALPLFFLTPEGRVLPATADRQIEPKPGWTVIALVSYDGEPGEREAKKARGAQDPSTQPVGKPVIEPGEDEAADQAVEEAPDQADQAPGW